MGLGGNAYGVPVNAMLGGKFRDKTLMCCDTHADGPESGIAMGKALKKRMDLRYTFLKMDVGINLLRDIPGSAGLAL